MTKGKMLVVSKKPLSPPRIKLFVAFSGTFEELYQGKLHDRL